MALDARFQIAPALEEYYVDKDTGLPLAAGTITFYSDSNRSLLKPVYTYNSMSGYTALPNPSTLSDVGTFQDGGGNNIIPYYFPFDGTPSSSLGNVELYYIEVKNADGVLQFTREAWPNFTGSGAIVGDTAGVHNYIPNGQFVAHNDFFPTSTSVTQKFSSLAPGGWFFVTNSVPSGTYTITWDLFLGSISGLNDYPRFAVITTCVSRGADSIQDLRIQWPDVNKFASADLGSPQLYTLFFNAQTKDSGTYNVDIYETRFFGTGGAPSPQDRRFIQTVQVTPSWHTAGGFNVVFNFSNTNAFTLGTNSDDYVALDFHVQGSGSFTIEWTDFALVIGSATLTSFPVQTNAQMLSEGVAGWMPTPIFDGSDLYCPLVLTPGGMIFDHSDIGKIRATTQGVVNNELLCDGSAYRVGGYSPLGIPYRRLFDTLFDPLTNNIVTGAGLSFLQSTVNSGNAAQLYLTQNTPGAVTHPADGAVPTNFTFRSGANGGAPFNYRAFANFDAIVNVVSTFTNGTLGGAAFTDGAAAQATGMAFTQISTVQGGCFYKTTIATVDGATLARPGNPGKYFTFSDHTTDYVFWFKITNETAPAVAGTKIQCDIDGSMQDDDTALAIATRLMDAQIDYITCGAGGTFAASAYFTFFANSPAPQKYVVWYKVDNVGTQPVVAGSPIYLEADVASTDISHAIAFKTQAAIAQYQFAVPDLRGVFMRGNDPTGIWDLSAATRWSPLGSIQGGNAGTFELDDVITHRHVIAPSYVADVGGGGSAAGGTASTFNVTDFFGGSENRPVNFSVNWVIKY